jgi:hypothetical protein
MDRGSIEHFCCVYLGPRLLCLASIFDCNGSPRFLIATEALDFYWLVFTLSLGRFVFPTWSVADLNLKLPPSALKHRFYWNENGEEISLNLNVLVSLDWSPWPRLPLLALHLRVCRS